MLLLARPVLDSGLISDANRLIRDAARLFPKARDALVLQETCDKLASHFGIEPGRGIATVKSRLAKRHDKILKDKAFGSHVTGASADFRDEAGRLLDHWDWIRSPLMKFSEPSSRTIVSGLMISKRHEPPAIPEKNATTGESGPNRSPITSRS